MNDDYISRKAVLDELKRRRIDFFDGFELEFCSIIEDIESFIKGLPTADMRGDKL